MAVNLLIYPIDYPASIVGPSDLELRVIELEAKVEASSILGLQDRRDAGNDAIDLELKSPTISVYHSAIPRFGFQDVNQGTTGYLLGGESQDSLTGRITKFDYLFETASLLGADLGIARHSSAGASAVAAGYLAGGNTSASLTRKIEKLTFNAEAVSLLGQQLPTPASEMVGFATTTESYFIGGFSGTGNTIVGEIRSLKHSTETTSLLSVTLSVPKSNAAIVGTTLQGFIVGGKAVVGGTAYSNTIEKMSWLTQSLAPAGFNLGTQLAFAVGVGNGFSGYIVGGRTGAATSTSISRIAHGTESISLLGISLSAPKSDGAAVGSSRLGYLMSGGTDPTGEFRSTGAIGSIQRLTFVGAQAPTERVEPLSFSLPYGACGAAGISNYSSGTYNSNSVSISNIYDGIYSKLGHNHNNLYPQIADVYYRSELRRKLSGDAIFYVDIQNATPAETGIGSQTNPFKSISEAIDWARGFDYDGYKVKIKVADGFYNESLKFDGAEWVGLSGDVPIELEGNLVNPQATAIAISSSTDRHCVKVIRSASVSVRGFRFVSTCPVVAGSIRAGCYVSEAGRLFYGNVIFDDGFDYNIYGQLRAYIGMIGNVAVVASVYVHVRLAYHSTWSIPSHDSPTNITFTPSLTMEAVFFVDRESTLELDRPYLTFTGSSIVTGRSIQVEGNSLVSGGEPGLDREDPNAYIFFPTTLGYRNSNNIVNLSQPQDVHGIKTFIDNIRVPDGVLDQDAVNLAQLNAVSGSTSGVLRTTGDQTASGIKTFLNNIRVPQSVVGSDAINLNQLLNHANYGQGFMRVGSIQIVFGRNVISGRWQDSGAPTFNIRYDSAAPGMARFNSAPSVSVSVDRLLLVQSGASQDNFGGYLDSPGGNIFQPDNCTMCWVAIGYIN